MNWENFINSLLNKSNTQDQSKPTGWDQGPTYGLWGNPASPTIEDGTKRAGYAMQNDLAPLLRQAMQKNSQSRPPGFDQGPTYGQVVGPGDISTGRPQGVADPSKPPGWNQGPTYGQAYEQNTRAQRLPPGVAAPRNQAEGAGTLSNMLRGGLDYMKAFQNRR